MSILKKKRDRVKETCHKLAHPGPPSVLQRLNDCLKIAPLYKVIHINFLDQRLLMCLERLKSKQQELRPFPFLVSACTLTAFLG